jgi:hypothetical protein
LEKVNLNFMEIAEIELEISLRKKSNAYFKILSGIGLLVREITEATGKKIISRPRRENIISSYNI